MYGASGKLGRGGGGKRNIHAPPINRNSAATSAGRLSSGAGAAAVTRGRDDGGESASVPTSSRQAEETFSLVTRNSLNFAMALRLVPDLVEEINRVEAMGGTARIKFDYNANNSDGNVITVGDKNFNFTWSKEMGELCDIYEERKNGEDGNGLLIESGGAWRKLNVQRILDESTKKHVKMRSEEAERKNKPRKSIVLDHQNSSMKNQMKALVASESNSWRIPFKRKEPPFKKSKPEACPAGGPSKYVYKSSSSAPNPSKNRPSTGSSLSSHTEQYGAPAHTSGSSNPMKGNAIVSDATPSQASSKATSLDKEMSGRMVDNTVLNKPVQNQNLDAQHFDLRSFIVSLLMEHNADGMSLKALEKAIGEAMPNSVQKIQPILKQIASFKAPGRYYLKPGVTENFKKTSSESGSSPEIVGNQSPATNNFDRLPDQDPNFSLQTPINELEEQAQLNSMCGNASDIEEKIGIPLNSPDHSNGKKVSDDSEGRASSSDGGSDSDSESNSSDSGSDSESNSREKRSPMGSRGESSSDSESDVSSSSKQAPDEDVDIMTSDDGKEPRSEPLSKSPAQSRPLDIELLDIGHYEKQDDRVSDVVEIENDNPEDDPETERATCSYLFSNEEGENTKPSSPNHYKYYENQGYDSVVNDGFNNGEPDSYTRSSKGKSRRQSNERHSVDRAYSSKRLKDKSLNQPFSGTLSSLFGESPQNSSPDELLKSSLEAPINQMSIRDASHGHCDPNVQVGFNQVKQSGSFSESRVPGQRSSDIVGRAEVHSNGKRPGKQDGSGCGVEESERGLQTSGRLWMQNPIIMETLHEDGDTGDKQTMPAESISRKPKTMVKARDAGRHSKTQTSYSPKDSNTNTVDKSMVTNGRDNKLQRELSELELGEFREPLPDEIPGPKKQFEKKGKGRQLEKKSADSDYWNSDSNRGKSSKKFPPGSRKLSPQNSETVISGSPDGPSKRKPPEINVNDPSKHQLRETRHQPQQHQSSAGSTEFVPNRNKIPEISRSRNAEPETQRTNSEANGYKKIAANATDQQYGLKRAVVSQSMNEFKIQEPNMIGSSNDRQKDTFLGGSNNGILKMRESFSDEKSCSYAKYEKEEPDLNSPIKDLSQYKEYVKEYQEKYESYCSLYNILESYRDEFSKLGNELETFRGRDNKRYQDILEQILSSFRQCGEKHKQFKKIFIVLHEELRHLKQRIKDFAASYTSD